MTLWLSSEVIYYAYSDETCCPPVESRGTEVDIVVIMFKFIIDKLSLDFENLFFHHDFLWRIINFT